MNKRLHIVCLDAPEPPDYGGAIDMYYKIVALAKSGIEIILHYFAYREDRNICELKKYCSVVYSYERSGFAKSVLKGLPYIVSSRINKKLIQRLNEDETPILLEGLHCTGLIPFLNKNRKVVIRVHNDEAVYYKHLAANEKFLPRKIFFKLESILLHWYQKRLTNHVGYAFLSQDDLENFEKKYNSKHSFLLPCFVPWQKIKIDQGLGNFCLYHGNLSVAENEAAAVWLINHAFKELKLPLVIAGSGISTTLQLLINQHPHITAIKNPSIEKINELVKQAQVHVLPSLNRTGVKLKLIHALFEGRYCVTNPAGVAGSGLEALVQSAETAPDYKEAVKRYFTQPFTKELEEQRKLLLDLYDNKKNAEKLIAWLY